MNRYRALFVGCGAMSAGWLSNLRDHFADRVEIVGLVDLNLAAAKTRATEFHLTTAWTGTSLDAALAELQPDVVFNITIPEAHESTCTAALRAGCHVLVEKPLAANVEAAQRLLAVAAESGKTLAVIQNRRYLAAAIAAQRALAAGVIGRVHTLYADFFLAPRFGGFRESMAHPLLLDMAVHTFDQGRFLTGLNAERATCHEFNPSGSWYAHGASAIATFEMAGGVIFNYRGSWCAQGFPTSWQADWRIIGERGTLLWDGENKVRVERVIGTHQPGDFFQPVEPVEVPIPDLPPAATAHAGNIAEFLDSLDSTRPPQTIATDNIHTLSMTEAAIKSAESGAPESIMKYEV